MEDKQKQYEDAERAHNEAWQALQKAKEKLLAAQKELFPIGLHFPIAYLLESRDTGKILEVPLKNTTVFDNSKLGELTLTNRVKCVGWASPVDEKVHIRFSYENDSWKRIKV